MGKKFLKLNSILQDKNYEHLHYDGETLVDLHCNEDDPENRHCDGENPEG
jgi:hypothetical protein